MRSNAERLHALYDGFWNQHDWHSGADVVAPDIEWIGMAEDATLGGTRHGARAVNQFFAEWLEAWEEPPHGVKAEAEIGQVWEFENGRATRQSMYRTYEEARQAADLLA